MWWVSLVACVLRGWKSIVRRSDPFFLAHVTMRWHHVTGSPTGTCSRTPSLTSRSRPSFTSSCQWRGTGIGEWWAVGTALGSIIRRRGGPSMRGRGWWSYRSRRNFSSLSRLSSVAGYGRSEWIGGGWERRGQGHGLGVSGCGVSGAIAAG